jgi:hypothetical protein
LIRSVIPNTDSLRLCSSIQVFREQAGVSFSKNSIVEIGTCRCTGEAGCFVNRGFPTVIYNNGSKVNLHFQSQCNTYGIKHKPTSVKNLQANAILERIHAVLGNMLHTSKLDMAETVKPSDIDIFLSDVAWAICSTYHTVLKASPGAAIFGRDMLFDIPFIADWQKIGEHWQQLTDLNNARENKGRIDYDYKVGQKVLLRKERILRNAESRWHEKPWLITSVHTNGTITVQSGNKIDRLNICRVEPFEEDLDNK